MTSFWRFLGLVWASPITFIGLVYAVTFRLLGWYVWTGVHGDALTFTLVASSAPGWLQRAWQGWGGHCVGNVVVMSYDPVSYIGARILKHEQVHIRQCMKLGVFQPILYAICFVTLKLGCANISDQAYHQNVFEIDARIGSGQEKKPALKKS